MDSKRQSSFPLQLLCVTFVAASPTITVAVMFFFCWLTEPPSFPGDPNIGLGLLYLTAQFNVPFVLLAWIGLVIWRQRNKPDSNAKPRQD